MVEGMRVQDWRQNDRQAGKTLAFTMWNSRVRLQVYDTKNVKDKQFNKSLTEDDLVLIEKYIAKVQAASPEQKFSIQFNSYDRNSKQYRLSEVLTIEKDSKQQYKISVTDCAKNTTFTFTLRSPATVTVGSEPLNDGMLSALKLDTLKDWITGAKIWAPFTFQPMQNGNGGYRSGNGGGAAVASGDGDLPF